MQLTFSPPLANTTTLRIPPTPQTQTSGNPLAVQTIRFTATFDSRASFLKAKTDGVRVELWTDLPVQGREWGEWGAVQFVQSDLDSGSRESVSFPSTTFLSADTGAVTREEDTLHLSLRVSLQDQISSRFHFTYRLVYPSGRVIWLGTEASNGVVTVQQGLPGIDLSETWQVHEDGKYHLATATSGHLMRLEEPEKWTIWAWKTSSLPVRYDRSTAAIVARALVLVPHASLRVLAMPVALAAKGHSTLRLALDGTVTQSSHSSDTEQAALGPLAHSRDLLEEVASVGNGIVLTGGSSIIITSHPSQAVLPIQLFVLPVATVASRTSIAASTLQSVIAPPPSGELILFVPETRGVKTLNVSSLEVDLVKSIDPTGGEAVVSSLHVVRDSDNVWQIALFAPHKDVNVRFERASLSQHLPTPPPSPPVPIALTQSTGARDPPQRPVQNGVVAPPDELSSPSAPVVQPRRSQNRPTLSLALTRNLPVRLLRAYLHTLFNLIFWFWNVFFKALAVRFVGERIPRRISSLFGLALSITASSRSSTRRADGLHPRRARPLQDSSSSRCTDNGGIPVEVREEAQSTATSNLNISVPRAQHAYSAPEEQEASSFATAHLVFSAYLTQGHVAPFVIWRGSSVGPALPHATLNGKALPAPSMIPAKDGAHIVLEFPDFPSEGRLEVSWDL